MEFQAHDKEIDFYSNQEIPDLVSQMLWLTQPTTKSLLTCNARMIKLWSIKDYQHKNVESSKRILKAKHRLVFPKSRNSGEREPQSKLKHTFKSGLETSLHSLSMTTDQQCFLSSDDKSINLWDLNSYDSAAYNLIDNNGRGVNRKDQPQFLISNASFNQFSQSSMFMYTTSSGDINICDIRVKSDF
jgi:hypothetical protein